MSDVTFRTAKAADLAAVIGLLTDDEISRAREGDVTDPHYREAFQAIDADPRNELVVAEIEGEVVGTCQLTFIPSLSRGGSERMLIEAVRVRSDLRGRGLGGQLIRWTLDRARQRGCRLAQLTTDKRRTDSHRFYEALGFEASHVGYKLTL